MVEVRICRNYYPTISVSLEVGQKLLDEMATEEVLVD
jgi:4-hydroxyphenylpyruvate dioxygenase-like putative hemolysin